MFPHIPQGDFLLDMPAAAGDVRLKTNNEMIKTSIIYNHRQRFSKNGTAPVEVRVMIGRRAYYINTGVDVRKKEWKFGRVENCGNAEDQNNKIAAMLHRVDEAVAECLKGGDVVTIDDIRQQVKAPDKRRKEIEMPDMLTWMEAEVKTLNVADGTRDHYRTVLARLAEYKKMSRWEDLSVEAISRWDEWLHTVKKKQTAIDEQLGKPVEYIGQSTVHNHHKRLKALLNRAVKYGVIASNPYERLRGDIDRGDVETVEFLTNDERDRIEGLTLPEGRNIAAARDMFIFQCYTGMAYSDAMAFSLDKCRREGDKWLYSAQRQKTGVWFYVQVLPKALAIAEKYGGSLPHVCNEIYNRKLKELAEKADITKKLTTHVGRHTFATWMLRNRVPIERVSKMLGHTKVAQTQRYAKVLAEDVYGEFDKFINT